MPSKITKAVFALIATLLALSLVVIASLGAWVMTGPKKLVQLQPYIESSLNPSDSPYLVKVDSVWVFWNGWAEPLDFRLRDVSIHAREKQAKLLTLSEMSVGAHIPSLMRFKIVPESVVIRSPEMRFYRDAAGQLHVGIGKNSDQRVPLHELFAGFDQDDDTQGEALIGDIRLISIQNARVTLGEPDEDALFDAQDANLHIQRQGDNVRAVVDVHLNNTNARNASIYGEMNLRDAVDMMEGKITLTDFSPHLLSKLFPNQPELTALEMPLNGWVNIAVNQSGHVTKMDYRLRGKDGSFTYPQHFAESLKLHSVELEGSIGNHFYAYDIKQAKLDFGGATLTASGKANRHPKGWTADINALAENMPVNDLYKYWPKHIAPSAYSWVTSHIREGVVPRAEAKLILTEDDLGQPFPASALDVQIEAGGVEVEYLDGHPKVKDVKGLVVFDGQGMTITSQQGAMLSGTVLKDALLEIPDLMAVPAPMHIALAIDAPAADVAEYVAIPALNYAEPLGLDKETISGKASGTMVFDFLLPSKDSEHEDPELSLLIEVDLQDAAQPDFMGDKNLSAVNGKLKITEETLEYTGLMSLSNAPLNVALTHYFKPAAEAAQTEYKAQGVMAVPQLAVFGIPELPFVVGNLGVDAHIRRSQQGVNNVQATINLDAVDADIRQIGLTKAAGVPAELVFDADTSDEGLTLNSFVLTSEDMHISGSATVNENMTALQKLRLDRIEFADNNFALSLDAVEGGYALRAKGASLDMQPFFAKEDQPEQPQPQEADKERGFALDAAGEFDWVVFGKEREMRRVNAKIQCGKTICEAIDISGLVGQNNRFFYELERREGVRHVVFNAQDAGGFLKAMNLYDNMLGGMITLNGHFDDTAENHPFAGRIEVTEHTITNAPVLAKMASLLSLTGIGDALQGKGIAFREITSEISYMNDVLGFRNGKAYGPALGVTVEDGALNTDSKVIQMTGTVVPSYTLNSVLGNIPVIGEALSGGKGEGIFAASYKVEGAYPDAVDVTVNPLTMLAPGFLRNVFGGGADTAAEAVATPEAEKQPEMPAPAAAPTEDTSQPQPVEAAPQPADDAAVTPPSQ